MRKLNNSGDTIVEVILAIGIISVVLMAAYVTINRATNNARQSQERGEATKIAESQLEFMKVNPLSQPIFTSATNPFCLDATGSLVVATDSACKVGTDSRYNISILRNQDPVTLQYTFEVTIIWDRAGSSEQDELKTFYRLYP